MTEESNMGQLLINQDSSFDKPDNSFFDVAIDRILKQVILKQNLDNIAIFQEAPCVILIDNYDCCDSPTYFI